MKRNTIIGVVVGLACGAGSFGLGVWVGRCGAHRPEEPAARRAAVAAERLLELLEAQLTTPCAEAREAALASDLQTLRSQIELYKVQHNDRLPGLGDDERFDGALFARQMLERTDAMGTVRESGDYGPYLTEMPANPFVEDDKAARVSGGRGDAPGDGSSGWYVNTRVGTIFANDPEPSDD